jgi:hypothetical protein
MVIERINSVEEGIRQMMMVAEYKSGYHYMNEAEADSMTNGNDGLDKCIRYHNEQAKLWEQVKKNLESCLP